jgi:hypothetical protein
MSATTSTTNPVTTSTTNPATTTRPNTTPPATTRPTTIPPTIYTAINEVLSNEDARLNDKALSIENAKTSKQRLISMNDNYSKRMQEYIKIIMVAIVSLLLFLGILLLKTKIPGVPEGFFLVLSIIIISAGAIYCIIIYKNLMNRDPTNFDEINPAAPVVLSQAEIDRALAASNASGDLTGALNLGGCIGPSCCDTTNYGGNKTEWDPNTKKCKGVDAFTSLAEAIGEYSNKNADIIPPQTKAYDEWEYTEYMKI